MDFRADVSSITAGATRLRGADRVIRDETTQAMNRSVLGLLGGVMGEAPVKTGHLRRGHTSKVESAGGTIRGTVGTNVPYARIVHDGRGPVVARGRALSFVIGGRRLFRKRVGPAKANPYFARAWTKALPKINREFDQIWPRVKTRLGL